MKRIIGSVSAATFLIVGALFAPPVVNDAHSQISIQLGGDFGRAKRGLIARGYSQIQLVGQGFTKFQVEACQNGIRYWFKSDSRGRTNQKRQIGVCQSTVTIENVQQLLASQGYSRINVEDRGGTFLAVACLGNDRMRIAVNNIGQIGKRRILGTCRDSLSPEDVAVSLQREGYTRIKFTNRQLPVYRVDACLGKRKYKLEVNQFAETLSQKRLGECRGPIDPRKLVELLERQGYSRIVVIDDKLPRYVAEVCEKSKRVELTLNRYGDVIERYSTGKCSRQIDRRQIVDAMRDQGYSRINVKRENSRGFVVEACYSGQLIRIDFNPYGEFLDERALGDCPRLSIRQIKSRLTERKFSGVTFYAQGCRKGKLIQFAINEYGDRSNRKIIGKCK